MVLVKSWGLILGPSQLLFPTPAVHVHFIESDNLGRPAFLSSTHGDGRQIVMNIGR